MYGFDEVGIADLRQLAPNQARARARPRNRAQAAGAV